MPSNLLSVSAQIGTSRTALITAAASKQTIIITGTVSNTDTTSKATQFVTIEVLSGATYRVILKEAPIAYGGALVLPKFVLNAGDTLYMTAGAASVIEGYISYVEKF